MKDQLIDRPPTIGDLKASGAIGIVIRCPSPCKNCGELRWDKLGLLNDTIFAKIATLKRLKCHFCGRVARPHSIEVNRGPMATWGMNPPG